MGIMMYVFARQEMVADGKAAQSIEMHYPRKIWISSSLSLLRAQLLHFDVAKSMKLFLTHQS